VVATDRKGASVNDLKAEDFSIQEDGAPQTIKVFNLPQAPQPEVLPEPVKLPPNMVSNITTFRSTQALSVVLLDALNTSPAEQIFAREEMLKFLEKLPAGRSIAVYAMGAKLRLLQDFTTDPSILQRAVLAAKDHAASEPDASAPYLSAALEQSMAQMGLQNTINQIRYFQQENTAAQTDIRVAMTVAALSSLARTLSGYPGRKNLIWISSAFPASIFPMTLRQDPRGGGGVQREYGFEIARLANALSDARVAVYPIDPRTLQTGALPSIGRDRELAQADDPYAAHETMNSVAERTGGFATYNKNDVAAAVRTGIEDGTNYYTLGYYPESKTWDGRFRKIVVKVNRADIRLRYRQGYFAIDPKGYAKLDPKHQALDLGQALSLDYPLSTALTFRAVVMPPSEKTGNQVMINYGVDAHALGFELQDDGLQHASIDCAAQAYTTKGNPVQTRANTFNAGLKAEQFQLVMQRFFPCNQALSLVPGDYVLRLGVRDNATGLIGTANARVTVAPVAASGGGPREK